jgi:hypothetical protein
VKHSHEYPERKPSSRSACRAHFHDAAEQPIFAANVKAKMLTVGLVYAATGSAREASSLPLAILTISKPFHCISSHRFDGFCLSRL